MGQKLSFQVGFQEYTPDTKPPKKEISPSLEKPKNKNEDSKLKPREIYIGHKITKKSCKCFKSRQKTRCRLW